MKIAKHQIEVFIGTVWAYYHEHRRDMPWRAPRRDGSFDPYEILVSEIMLQQTQAARVTPKYMQFLKKFPDVSALSSASLADVLHVWSGLGYNRRAKFLWQSAQKIVSEYNGSIPSELAHLKELPGIGPNTAAAILVYSYNQPQPFVETNIRTVYIHHFFGDTTDVSDAEILQVVEQTLDTKNSREWYWALMDYGVFLKQTVGNTASRSKHYTKQTAFKGSVRQIRGEVIRFLTTGTKEYEAIVAHIDDERLDRVLDTLKNEGFIRIEKSEYSLC